MRMQGVQDLCGGEEYDGMIRQEDAKQDPVRMLGQPLQYSTLRPPWKRLEGPSQPSLPPLWFGDPRSTEERIPWCAPAAAPRQGGQDKLQQQEP